MSTTSIAILSDIHGNSFALREVLRHARELGISSFVDLGDTYYGPLDPLGTWLAVAETGMTAVLGNQDRILVSPRAEMYGVPTFRHTMDSLPPDALRELSERSACCEILPGVLAFHGTPQDDCRYMLEDVASGRPELRACENLLACFAESAPRVALCGHSHLQAVVDCGGTLVLNPGSVGLPAYDDDDPPHAMAAGTPEARYAVLEMENGEPRITLHSVSYDHGAAACLAEKNGRSDWARWLATGTVD